MKHNAACTCSCTCNQKQVTKTLFPYGKPINPLARNSFIQEEKKKALKTSLAIYQLAMVD